MSKTIKMWLKGQNYKKIDWQGKTEVLGESLSYYYFVQHKYHLKWPGNHPQCDCSVCASIGDMPVGVHYTCFIVRVNKWVSSFYCPLVPLILPKSTCFSDCMWNRVFGMCGCGMVMFCCKFKQILVNVYMYRSVLWELFVNFLYVAHIPGTMLVY
jgi:hypothetical protein